MFSLKLLKLNLGAEEFKEKGALYVGDGGGVERLKDMNWLVRGSIIEG